MSQAAVSRADHESAEGELAHLPAFDRHTIVIEIDDADVAELVWRRR